jgi:protein-disulfide isomerase
VRRNLPFLIIAGVLLVAIVAGFFLYRARMEPPATPTPAPTAAASSPTPLPMASATPVAETTATPEITASPAETTTSTPTAARETSVLPTQSVTGPVFTYGRAGAEPMHVRGDSNAPVVLEEFGDFECLPCSKLFPVLETLEKEFGDRLVVVFRQHPLRMHRYALDAARAAEAAGFQGKFWEMHDALYRNRATWVPAPYVRPYFNEYAKGLELDLDRFKEDMDAKKVSDRIVADQERGDSLGVDRTPIVFVNGEKVLVTDLNENGLRRIIETALAAKGR